MKKKLLLIALPAMMALSGCARVNLQPALNNNASLDAVVEDNVSHDELFGASKELKGPAIRNMNTVNPDFDYDVGYQLHFEEGSVIDSEPDDDDRISIRFVAALRTNFSKIVWSRGFTSNNGVEKLTYSSNSSAPGYPELESKVIYTSLSNGEEDRMVAGEGAYDDCVGFAVYSLTNIPYKEYLNYYLGVSVTLTPAEGAALKSQLCVITVERDSTDATRCKSKLLVQENEYGFKMFGLVNGVPGSINADNPTKGSNAASFTSNFKANDSFIIYQKTENLFKVWDGTCIDNDTHFSNNAGPISAKTEGYFTLYLNNNMLYPAQYRLNTDYYVRGSAAQGWGVEDCVDAYRFLTDPDNKGVLLNVHLNAGEFKIGDASNDWHGYNLGSDRLIGPAKDDGHVETTNGGASQSNIKCNHAGYYNLYLTNNDFISIVLVSLDD